MMDEQEVYSAGCEAGRYYVLTTVSDDELVRQRTLIEDNRKLAHVVAFIDEEMERRRLRALSAMG